MYNKGVKRKKERKMKRMTIMTNEEINLINEQIRLLKETYFGLIDANHFDEAEEIYNEIAKLNNSIH